MKQECKYIEELSYKPGMNAINQLQDSLVLNTKALEIEQMLRTI